MVLTPPRPEDPTIRFERRLAALERRLPVVTASEVTTASRSLQEGEYARVLPPVAGLTLALPEARSVNRGAQIWVSVEGSSGTVTLVAVNGLVQGASSVPLTTVGLYCLASDGVAGWWLTTTNLAALAGAGLTYSAGVLAVQGSTSITVTGDQVTRAAFTGDVTASANSNATTIANDAVTNAKLANMAARTIKGREDGVATGDPQDLVGAEVGEIVRFASLQTDSTSTGTITTYAVTENTNVVRFTSGITALTIRGATIPGETGQLVIWENNDDTGVNVTFNNEDGSAAAAGNRFRIPGGAGAGTYVLAPAHRIITCYINSRWRIVGEA